MDPHAPGNTLRADQCIEFIDEDVKDVPEFRLKAPPIIPRLVVPDSNQGAEHS